MEFIIASIIISILIIAFMVYSFYHYLRQQKYNRMLKKYKRTKHLLVVETNRPNKWRTRMITSFSFLILVNAISLPLSLNQTRLAKNANNVSYNATYPSTIVENNQAVDSSNALNPSSSSSSSSDSTSN